MPCKNKVTERLVDKLTDSTLIVKHQSAEVSDMNNQLDKIAENLRSLKGSTERLGEKIDAWNAENKAQFDSLKAETKVTRKYLYFLNALCVVVLLEVPIILRFIRNDIKNILNSYVDSLKAN